MQEVCRLLCPGEWYLFFQRSFDRGSTGCGEPDEIGGGDFTPVARREQAKNAGGSIQLARYCRRAEGAGASFGPETTAAAGARREQDAQAKHRPFFRKVEIPRPGPRGEPGGGVFFAPPLQRRV